MSAGALNVGREPDVLEMFNHSVNHSEVDFLHLLSDRGHELLDGGWLVLAHTFPQEDTEHKVQG